MKFNIKMITTLVILAIVLCSAIATVQSAPTASQNAENFEVQLRAGSTDATGVSTDSNRSKRAIIFRPLFVYRQQQIKRQLVDGQVRLSKSNPDKVDFNYYEGQFPSRRQ